MDQCILRPPPPPYTRHDSSSSYPQPTRLSTSDHATLPNIPIASAVPTTVSGTIPTLTVHTPSTAPFAYNKQVAQQAITSLLSECHKCKTGCRFMLQQFKQPLVLYDIWTGHTCRLLNHHEHILVHGSVIAYDTIQFENMKGNITVDGNIVCGKEIYVKVNKGTMVVHGLWIVAKNAMNIEASHSPLQLQCLIEAKRLNFTMKDAPLVLNQVSLVQTLNIRAEKASVEVYIVDIRNRSAKINIETSHAFVTVYLSHQFSGEFNVESKRGSVAVNNRTQVDILDYKRKDRYRIEGSFKHGRYAKHRIHIKTSKAPAVIHII